MRIFQRLNGAMAVGAACALLLIYHLVVWLAGDEIHPTMKMFATIIIISTIGVMFWFSGDNYSRDKALLVMLDERFGEIANQVAKDLHELGEKIGTLALAKSQRHDELLHAMKVHRDQVHEEHLGLAKDMGRLRIGLHDVNAKVDTVGETVGSAIAEVSEMAEKQARELLANAYVDSLGKRSHVLPFKQRREEDPSS